jgi:hypothetical protein
MPHRFLEESFLGLFQITPGFSMYKQCSFLRFRFVSLSCGHFRSHAAVIALSILLGFFSCLSSASSFLRLQKSVRSSDLDQGPLCDCTSSLMYRLGLTSAVASVAGLTGIPISGALKIDGMWANGFGPLILFSGMTCAISGVIYGEFC